MDARARSDLRTHCLILLIGLSLAGVAACAGQAGPIAEDVSAPREALIARTSVAIAPRMPETDPGQIAAGRDLAVRQCSTCHALDAGSTSPRPGAPPLKSVLWRYDEDALATHLIEGIRVGHADMPLFDFNVIGADALIAYLRSIRAPREERGQ